MNWQDMLAGLMFPLALLIIAIYIVATLLFQSPLVVSE